MRTMNKMLLVVFLLISGISFTFFYVGYRSYKAITRKICTSKIIHARHKRNELITNYGAQEVTLHTKDGIALKTLYVKRSQAKRMFVIMHGYRQTKESYAILAQLFPDDTLLFIDLRAHGESDGNLISYGYFEALDAQAAFDYLKKSNSTLPIIGLGFSMGAVALAQSVANGTDFSALILDCAFCNLRTQIDRLFCRFTGFPSIFNFFGRGFYNIITGTSTDQLDVSTLLENKNIPLLIIHCKEDRTTPVVDAYSIYTYLKKHSNNKNIFLWVSPTGKHVGLARKSPIIYKQKLDEFLKSVKL